MQKNRLGIYMGSFNPPHKGHLAVVNYLLDNNYLDEILIVPTMNYWDKQDLINIDDRIKMLKFFENDKIKIDTENNQYIYTVELMEVLIKKYPNEDLSIIMGADNIINFHKWKNYKELLTYHIIVMNRDNIDIKKYLKNLKGHFTIIDDYPYIPVASSAIRNNLSSKYLDKKVLDYIKKHNLYNYCFSDSLLLNNIDKIHTTLLGKERIIKNLKLPKIDVIDYLKKKILDKKCVISKKGKNYYCEIDNIIITINSYNYCIITAHLKDR